VVKQNVHTAVVPTTPVVSISPTLKPTEIPIQKEALKIEVQNGSGETGLAGKGKAVLEKAGYASVTTANADTYDYTGVTVKGKTSAIASFIVGDLKATYKHATASGAVLDTSSAVDAIVILGKDAAL
jgi:hypothetical protein